MRFRIIASTTVILLAMDWPVLETHDRKRERLTRWQIKLCKNCTNCNRGSGGIKAAGCGAQSHLRTNLLLVSTARGSSRHQLNGMQGNLYEDEPAGAGLGAVEDLSSDFRV
jgi:hypothetical protein